MQGLSLPPGMEPMPPAVEVRSLNRWATREIPLLALEWPLRKKGNDLEDRTNNIGLALFLGSGVWVTDSCFKILPGVDEVDVF